MPRPITSRLHTRDRKENDPTFLEWQAARKLEIEEEQRQQEAADAGDPVKAFQKSANALAESTRTALVSNTNLFPNIERIAGRSVNEDVAAQNYKWWAENTGKNLGFERHHSAAVLDCWRRNDLVPTADAFTAVFQSLKDYDLLNDQECGSPDTKTLEKFGTTVKDDNITEAQAAQALDQFVSTSGFRKSDANGKLLLKTLIDYDLRPWLENLLTVNRYLKSLNAYLEPTTSTPSEQAAQRRHDYLFKIVVTDPRDGKQYAEADLAKLNADVERFLRRYAEKGHTGNQNYDTYLEVKNLQAVRDARIAAEGEQQ